MDKYVSSKNEVVETRLMGNLQLQNIFCREKWLQILACFKENKCNYSSETTNILDISAMWLQATKGFPLHSGRRAEILQQGALLPCLLNESEDHLMTITESVVNAIVEQSSHLGILLNN